MEFIQQLTLISIVLCIPAVRADVVLCMYSNNTNECVDCDFNITITADHDDIIVDADAYASDNITLRLCSPSISLQDLVLIKDIKAISICSELHNPVIITCNGRDGGFQFQNVKNIMMENFKICNCGAEHNSTSIFNDTNIVFKASIYILNCSNIEITNVEVKDNHATGLAIIDSNGHVLISNCNFTNNSVQDNNHVAGGGGAYIEFSYCTPGGLNEGICNGQRNDRANNSRYRIEGCMFKDNFAATIDAGTTFQGLGRGGGLCIRLKGHSSENFINVTNCSFEENSAIWGGGLYISFQNAPASNVINIENSTFIKNVCTLNGGGGVVVGFLFFDAERPKQNDISFQKCNFLNNSADFGGGIFLYYSKSSDYINLENNVSFDSCSWNGNKAKFGSAVNIATDTRNSLNRGYTPSPIFKDSAFEVNNVNQVSRNSSTIGKGTFMAVRIDVIFEGTTSFERNSGTALYLTSSKAEFAKYSQASFIGNHGKNGGAIVISGLGSLVINDNSSFVFEQNNATEMGGAIYQASYNHNDYVANSDCFIQYAGNTSCPEDRDIHFIFRNNSANNGDSNQNQGPSIFATTLKPCYTGCLFKTLERYNETFSCIANFSFEKEVQFEVSTRVKEIIYTSNNTLCAIPGNTFKLPIGLKDDLNNKVNTLYHVYMQKGKEHNVFIPSEYTYISNNIIKLFGTPGNRVNLIIETVSSREIAILIPIQIQECPPGFVYVVEKEGEQKCKCSTNTDDKKKVYVVIEECKENNTMFSATMRLGYWIGYENTTNDVGKERNLISSYCPRGYCRHNETARYHLPNNTNVTLLNEIVCGENRRGKICGKCQDNLSSYYHSVDYKCSSSKKCHLGFIYYALSEIMPITILFIVIIIFDISFTKGGINTLVFSFQVVSHSLAVSSGFLNLPSFDTIFTIYSFISGLFNLSFFQTERLSFCLWNGAQSLDVIAFKYVTIIYSLLLVMVIIVVQRICNVRKITQKLCCSRTDSKTSIIQGLSGFLILCYSESIEISLIILTPVTLYSNRSKSTAAFYDGEFVYLRGEHLKYALPASLFLLLGFIPPILLFSYPLCYRLFGALKMSESRFVGLLCKCIPLEKFKPFFDSFQSSFKDEYRFFSGLYFIYRFNILLAFFFTKSITDYYFVVIIMLMVILCLHAIVQPYKKRWHNVIDLLMLSNLIIINATTVYNYRRAIDAHDYTHSIQVISGVQIIFIYMPLLYLFFLVIRGVIHKITKRIKHKHAHVDTPDRERTDSLLFEERESSINKDIAYSLVSY